MVSIIFDLDGVMFDSELFHAKSWQDITSELGINFDDNFFLDWVGIHDKVFVEYLQTKFGVSLSYEHIIDKKRKRYQELAKKELKPFPGVIETLKQLKEKKIPYAIASSAYRVDAECTMSYADIRNFFDIVVTGDDVSNRKPKPDVYLKASQLLDVKPQQCIAIEDSPAGIESAISAGCRVFGITSSHKKEKLLQAEKIFSTTPEAVNWILKEEL